jgi:LacI family transcriptional regulator
VLLNRTLDGAVIPQLNVDWASGIRDIVRHLTGLGHRRVAYLQGPPASRSNAVREQALDTAVGIEVVKIACGAMFTDGHGAAGQVLDAGVTAVIAFNDVVALGLLGALHEMGTEVPGALSVAGFDDIPFAAYTWPPLTTAWVPQEQLGRLAWDRLRDLLTAGDAPSASPTLPVHREREVAKGSVSGADDSGPVLLRPRLVVRGSTGRAPIPP